MKINLQLFEEKDLTKIHDYTLRVLENPRMKILEPRMLSALEKKGARVDYASSIVNFPATLIEDTINLMKKDITQGRVPKYMNGVTSEKTEDTDTQAKFGGACIQYLDWEKKQYRDPTESDLIDTVKLGQMLDEVKTVGNPVVYIRDENGNPIDPKIQRVKTVALIAKYTTKPGPTEVWNAKELEYLIEIGVVVKGSIESYMKDPCFITAKETIAPLILDQKSSEVLLALAEKNLPCTIIPMPITGVSSPVSLFSNVVIGNSEILGTATAIKAVYPNAPAIGGIISGSMDMATGTANFATPEATLQDLALAEVHERLYGFNFGMGGYIDAKYPGIQSTVEKEFKYFILALSGRFTYPVGLVNWGKCFSLEQALVDIQILKNTHKFLEGIKISDEDEILSLIRKVGIGGSFLQEEHTLLNFKKNLMVPELFDHTLSQGYENDIKKDMLVKAHDKVEKTLNRDDLYEIELDKAKEIDEIVKRAETFLL